MAIVAGVDFGTLSVRVSLFDHERGRLGAGVGEYPLHRRADDPNHATQSHNDQLRALQVAMAAALAAAKVDGRQVEALAIDATGSSVIPVGRDLEPLDEYYLWCDHRSWREAGEITATAHRTKLPAIEWCGGTYSSEWGFSKLLHWLRHNPEKRGQFVSAFDNCDLMAATLCGIKDPHEVKRSACAMGHKWMWNRALGGLPPEEFLVEVDPVFQGIRAKLDGPYGASNELAGRLSEEWAARLGLRAGIPIPVGALDAHWDAVGAGIRVGDVVNVIGTSTCVMAISPDPRLIPGVSGVAMGSIDPDMTGIEAGLSAVGDMFDSIATRAGSTVAALSQGLANYRAGQTGLMRLAWDNGDRTVLVNPQLGGVTLGWNLGHTAADELAAAIEGTAFHTRVILERMEQYGTPVHRVIHGGGIPQKSEFLNRVYASVLNKPVLVPSTEVTSLGAAMFAFVAAGTFGSLAEAQAALGPQYRTIEPDAASVGPYQELFESFSTLYFALGDPRSGPLGQVLPALRRISGRH